MAVRLVCVGGYGSIITDAANFLCATRRSKSVIVGEWDAQILSKVGNTDEAVSPGACSPEILAGSSGGIAGDAVGERA